jgi:rhodanese-related sulfurtransferase
MKTIPSQELEAMLQAQPDLQLLDVRTPSEFTQLGHIPQANLFPLQAIELWSQELDPQKPYVLLCQHGVRSLQACQFLEEMGFQALYNLERGMSEWVGSLSHATP